MKLSNSICLAMLLLITFTTACAHSTSSPTRISSNPWIEEEVTFTFGQDELYGILTLPTSEGPYPAIVLVSGSINPSTGTRDGVSAEYYIDHAHQMVLSGFAVLRYDPPGVGQSKGERGIESLDSRTEEAVAVLHFLQSRTDIWPDRVGLWSNSQGAWVIAMAAAGFPKDVAFVISVSGSGVPVAEQQVFSIQAQSEAAGMSEQNIAKAVLFGRMLIDWQLVNPIYREVNEAQAQALGNGPWNDFMGLVYEPGEITPAEGLQIGIEILKSIQDETWARFLYLKHVYIPQLESIPPEQLENLKAITGPSMLNDPKDYLTRIHCPVLAFFGETDVLQPTERSAALYRQYLNEAGNENYEIVVIPHVGHGITLSIPAYRDALARWLDNLYAE